MRCGTSGRLEDCSAQDSHSIEIARAARNSQAKRLPSITGSVQMSLFFCARFIARRRWQGLVTFEPGAGAWHTHRLVQTLLSRKHGLDSTVGGPIKRFERARSSDSGGSETLRTAQYTPNRDDPHRNNRNSSTASLSSGWKRAPTTPNTANDRGSHS